MRAAAAASQGSPIPRSAGLSRRSRGARTLERMDITRDTVFIPGATSGIGLALARRLQDRGSTVIIGGRRQELLGRLAAEHGFGTVRIDTTDPERVRAASAEVIARWPEVNAVVLMAGIMVPEDWRTPAFLDTAERIVETNVLGPIRLIAAFIEHLRSRPAATIVTVSSGLASVPLRPTPTYNASKAFVHMLSESIRLQLEGTGVAVTEVVPPSVQTDLMPGQAENPLAMPLGEFADEVLSLLETQPEAHEILVERVKFLRFAEVRGEYDQVVEAVNATDPHARG
jgi:short-subunit dehydrogenase involved in D-alanine esterification of teichoic acids